MVEHCPGTRNHHRAPGVGSGTTSCWHYEYRAVDKSPTQLGETFLPLLVPLLFGRADFGAAVSGGRRHSVTGWLNSERTHHERGEVVGSAHSAPPVGRRRVEQEAVRWTGYVRKRAHEALRQLRVIQQLERAYDRVGRRRRSEHGAAVRGEAFRDLLGALAFVTGRVEDVPGLSEGQRVAD